MWPSVRGFAYSRNSERELSTEDANRLRTLFGLPPIAEFANHPKFVNLDATLQKRYSVGRQGVRLTLAMFNALNIAQRTAPNAQILNNLFGTYAAVAQPRAMQFTVQYDF